MEERAIVEEHPVGYLKEQSGFFASIYIYYVHTTAHWLSEWDEHLLYA